MRSFTRLATFAAIGFAMLSPAMAGATSTDDAKKICLERYNLEKDGGTIPVGMSKAKYMSQCTNSIRRQAKLEQELTEQAAGNNGNAAGTNKTSFTSPKTSVGASRDQ